VDTIMWKHFGTEPFSGTVRIYDAGSAIEPGAMLTSEPFSISGAGWFNVTLTTPIYISGNDLWLCVEGTHETGEYPLECSEPGITGKTAFFSTDGTTWYDLPGLGYDVAWEIRGHLYCWEPGTFPVEGIIKNFGVTYSEVGFPINAQFTNDSGDIFYDETIIVTKLLAPGENTTVIFPDVVIPENVSWYGRTTLTMRTQLVGDDHPENDKKTISWYIPPPIDDVPPVTNATVTGTIGQNEWFISNVHVTLIAIDYCPEGGYPLGVNNTFYKIDFGDWQEYSLPITVDTDGYHTVYFYSDDNQIPPNVEEEKNISFKIDTTAPEINTFTVTAQNALKTRWLFEADTTDVTSGIVLLEFYADDALVCSTNEAHYEFLVEQKISTAQCIVYDAAGNSKMSEVVTSYEYGSQQQYYTPMQLLQQKEIKRQLDAMKQQNLSSYLFLISAFIN